MDKVNLCMHRYEYLAETERRLDDLHGCEVYQTMIAVQCPYCYTIKRITIEQWEQYKKTKDKNMIGE